MFRITNYRKIQERDLFWQQFRYVALGILTIAIIIFIIILSMINKRPNIDSHIINIQHLNEQSTSTKTVLLQQKSSKGKRKRRKI
ncbi:unnamed protein product [Adineta ricciae]|uniref:Uncharacterized protein n=1 Tax=Adineta ricciae TaxID=249248 RepID=A0A814MEE4_ADIRI|nr:unnamed protein product [Adineta ricciae]